MNMNSFLAEKESWSSSGLICSSIPVSYLKLGAARKFNYIALQETGMICGGYIRLIVNPFKFDHI
jgi:hypothetical protein